MKEATRIQDGGVVDYTALATHANGDILPMVGRVGVLLDDAVSGDTISLAIEGTFEIAALNADLIAFGVEVWFDATARTVTTTASTHQKAGIAVSTKAATTDGSILVKIG